MCAEYLNDKNYFGFITLPINIKDPDEFIEKNGVNNFITLEKSNKSIELAYIEYLFVEYNITDPKHKTITENLIKKDFIEKIKDKNLSKNYQSFFYNYIKNKLFNLQNNAKNSPKISSEIQKKDINATTLDLDKQFLNKIEQTILKIIISNLETINNNTEGFEAYDFLEVLSTLEFTNQKYEEYFKNICIIIDDNKDENKSDNKNNSIKSLFYQFYDENFKLKQQDLMERIRHFVKQHKTKIMQMQISNAIKNDNTSLAQTLISELQHMQ